MSNQPELFRVINEMIVPTNGKIERDRGIKRVSDHNVTWMDRCIVAVQNSIALDYFTGEDIRLACENYVGSPRHHNAWGALINSLIKRKIIVATGEYRQMKDVTSHARSTPVYRKA